MPRKPVPSKPGRGPSRSPKVIARALVEAETETDAAVAERYGLGKTTLQKWRLRRDEPEIAAELSKAHRRLELAWVGKQGRALGSAWSMVDAAAKRMQTIIEGRDGPIDEASIAELEVLTSIIDKAGGTLGGIDYAQRRAGALNGNPDPAPDSDDGADRPRGPQESLRSQVH